MPAQAAKSGRHHNTDGRRQIERGSHRKPLARLAKRLGVRFLAGKPR